MRRRIGALKAFFVVGIAGLFVAAVITAVSPAAEAATSHNPFGHLDVFSSSGPQVTISGWVADPDTSGTVRVVVSIDNVPAYSLLANQPRPDVARYFPSYGPNRGFSATFRVAAGNHVVCVTAGNLADGADTTFKCGIVWAGSAVQPGASVVSSVATQRPFGHLDSYSLSNGKLSVSGWAIDPDTAASVQVDVTIDGSSYGSALANASRADIQHYFPLYGAAHGFSYTVDAALAPGNYQLCVVAVNTAAGGNTILPCLIFTVLPATTPTELQTSTASAAADAIQAQAIRSGAASAASFPAGASAGARLAIATRALLLQAAGRSTRPPAVGGLPNYAAATTVKPVDEQAVMGPTPYLGSYPAAKTGGRTGLAHSLELFANDALTPPGGAGVGLVGAAPVLPANGTTVRPSLPTYPAGHPILRAEVAVSSALSHLGDPYVYSAAGPASFDCSGLTQYAWALAGVNLTHYTGAQALQGVRVLPNQLLPGDLVLFGSDLHHVGMYLGAGYMIDSPYTGAYVRVDKISWFGDFTLAVRP